MVLFFHIFGLSTNHGPMKKLITAFLASFVFPAMMLAQQGYPVHEVRIGWGDMGFEKAAFRNSLEQIGYRYFGHIFAGYRYSFNDWLGAGMDFDFSNVSWKLAADGTNHDFQNISFIPSVRFTYFRKGIVTMYSGLGIGLNVNTGSEADFRGLKTVCAPVLNPVFYAISLNYRNWFGTFELGPLVSLNSRHEIFLLGARLISLSIGYRI